MLKSKKVITCDGNHAAAHVAYMFSELACIYPITPSSNMAENVDEWASEGRKNIFGETVKVAEMQSEAGAVGAVHGSLQSGALTTTFTSSQGLLLMIPNMYKISGELLPTVFHIAARAIAAQALSIFGDHSDVMSTRSTGFALLASGSVQQIMDLGPVAHLATLKARVPFLHFFDGFRTSHEIQKIEYFDNDDLAPLLDLKAINEFRQRALNPEHPVTRGTAQNPDVYFQTREAANKYYDAVPDIVEYYMQQISKLVGREYHPFTYFGSADAENIIIAMGSTTETIKEVVDSLMSKGEKVGLITVHLYRPFSTKYLFNVMPKTVKRIAVLDRTKEPGANGEPLYLDVKEVFYDKENRPLIVGGRYGLSSKDTTPAMIISVFDNLKLNEPKNRFTVGIVDDVTFTSLPLLPEIDLSEKGTVQCKFYGLGSDGTVGANKNSIKIIGENTDKYAQAYFAYDSKKSGGITISHLRFGNHPIRSPYLVNTPDFVACHVPAYLEKYDMLKGLKKGGTFLLNSIWSEEETKKRLPNSFKKYLAQNEINFYIINATEIAESIGLGNRTNSILQSAFFKISNVISFDLALSEMKNAIKKTYSRKGEKVVQMNYKAVDAGANPIKIDVPSEWASITEKDVKVEKNVPDFIKNIVFPINDLKGDDLPVSTFVGYEDGTFISGTSRFEKRGIAVNVPEWIPENCTQCNQCSYVCPHAAIRPFLLTEEESKNAPTGTKIIKATGKDFENYNFKIQVSVLDCTGCGNCANVCPGKKGEDMVALKMKPLGTQLHEVEAWDYFVEKVKHKTVDKFKTFKSSQFSQPLFEFSGACAGCGETPYVKLITQLYGEKMIIANATGCSSIYGGSAPATPYCTNTESGKGVAWGNSLFEDNAEYGYGITVGIKKIRETLVSLMKQLIEKTTKIEVKEVCLSWIENKDNSELNESISESVIKILSIQTDDISKKIIELKQYLSKKSIWIIGGDGWAYDIGFGGLDHVLASGENLNVLVLDTEVYSNTGGQASKSSPLGAIAKFAASGKRIRKKDLGMIAVSYGYIYVAQVAMGADNGQFFRAVKEAEAYNGPSIIIAYAPCINHGISAGMGKSQIQEKLAVNCGYWSLFRYNPQLEKEGKNPFKLDSKEPDWTKFKEYLSSEVRFASLKHSLPQEAETLYNAAEENAKWRYESYKKLVSADIHEKTI